MGIKAIIATIAILAVAPASAEDVFFDAARQAEECINQRINAERIRLKLECS